MTPRLNLRYRNRDLPYGVQTLKLDLLVAVYLFFFYLIFFYPLVYFLTFFKKNININIILFLRKICTPSEEVIYHLLK